MNKPRIAFFDFLKAMAITMVVWGHFISRCMPIGLNSQVRMVLDAISIPLFLMVSGLFLRPKALDGHFWKKLFRQLILPFLTWTIILATINIGRGVLSADVLNTAGIYCYALFNELWYVRIHIVCLLLWHILPVKDCRLKYIIGVLLVLLFNLLLMHLSDDGGTLMRVTKDWASTTLYAFSIFALGTCMKSLFAAGRSPKALVVQGMLFGIIALACLFLMRPEYHYFVAIFGRLYESGDWYIFFLRMCTGVCAAMSLIFIVMSCARYLSDHSIVASIGQHTVQLYMFQALVVEVICQRTLSLPDGPWGYAISLALSIIFVWLGTLIVRWTSRSRLFATFFWGTKV